MTGSDTRPARSPYLITAPTPATRQYDLVVLIPRLPPGRRPPSLRIIVNCETKDVRVSIPVRQSLLKENL
jgi:hypothetical protein